MKREASAVTASVVAVAALFGASSLQSKSGANSAAQALQERAAASTHARRVNKPEPGPCDKLQDLFVDFFALKSSVRGAAASFAPTSCNDDGKNTSNIAPPENLRIRVVLATLPDPIHTNIPLVFDRYASAIQQAALSANYNYDSSWLPWQSDRQSYALLADQDKADSDADAREDQPGALLFRKHTALPANLPYGDTLVVLIVGEAATSGIHRTQFKHAVDWLKSLQTLATPDSVQILGPSFSGSLASLDELLREREIADALMPPKGEELHIYSGQITNKSAVDWFRDARMSDPALPVRFHSFQQDRETVTSLYLHFLDGIGVAGCHLSIVSEDETAFGSDKIAYDSGRSPPRVRKTARRSSRLHPDVDSTPPGPGDVDLSPEEPLSSRDLRDCTPPSTPCPDCARSDAGGAPLNPAAPTRFFYPRDISALRAAYQEQSLFSRSGSDNADNPRRTLREDLSGSTREPDLTDTIHSYGGSQTALTEEANLLQVVNMMRAHRTQFILLLSSNSLDQIFLTKFFKLTYPEGRVAILGNDLLLRREVASGGMTGVTTLGAWPLLPEIDHWTRKFHMEGDSHLHLAFPQGEAQGDFVALSFLLAKPSSPECIARQNAFTFLPPNCGNIDIPDYRYPFWLKPITEPDDDRSAQVPVTWLSVLGGSGFSPVASLDAPLTADADVPTPLDAPALLAHSTSLRRPATSLILMDYAFIIWDSIGDTLHTIWCGTPNTHFRDLPLSMNVCLCLVLLWAVFHLTVHSAPSITVKPTHRTSFVRLRRLVAKPVTSGSHPHAHLVLVVLGSVLLTVVATLLASAYGWMSVTGPVVYNPGFYALFPIIVWILGFCAVFANVWVEHRLSPEPTLPLWWRTLLRLVAALRRRLGFIVLAATETVPVATRTGEHPGPFEWSHGTSSIPSDQTTSAYRRAVQMVQKRPFWWRSIFPASVRGMGEALVSSTLPLVAYTVLTFAFYCFYLLYIDRQLPPQVSILTYLRSIDLTTGVSPIVPLVLLPLGMYGWCWATLHGLCLFGDDRPVLPSPESLEYTYEDAVTHKSVTGRFFTMLDSVHAAARIEDFCAPFGLNTICVFLLVVAGLAAADAILVRGVPLRSLGTDHFAWVVSVWLVLMIGVLLANAWQLTRLWLRLREMLVFLDRLPIRRTLQAMRGFSWDSIWKMGGNVLDIRYRLFYRQFETLNHLKSNLDALLEEKYPTSALSATERTAATACLYAINHESIPMRHLFASWYAEHWDNWIARDLQHLKAVQACTASLAANMLIHILMPAWKGEKESLLVLPPGAPESSDLESEHMRTLVENLPPHIRDAEEIVCLIYLGFIQNILGRMRSFVLGMIALFLAIAFVVPSYPFDPRPLLTGSVITLFLVVGLVVFSVYSQMFRDATLSHLTNTKPGQLGSEFWLKFIGFGIGPIFGLLASLFPQLSSFISSWLAPGISSIK